MTLSAPEKLAHYVQSLPSFEFHKTIDGNYNHIGATIADAVLQANNKYSTHVKPRVNRILATYPEMRTTSSMLRLLESIAVTKFLDWRGIDRAERFRQVLNLFAAEGIEVESDLREWLSQESSLRKLGAIKGIGPKTTDYFKILVGVSTSAIDRHLLKFLELAGLAPRDYHDAQAIINATADILSVDRAHFDHSIWQFMSKGGVASQAIALAKCKECGNDVSTIAKSCPKCGNIDLGPKSRVAKPKPQKYPSQRNGLSGIHWTGIAVAGLIAVLFMIAK